MTGGGGRIGRNVSTKDQPTKADLDWATWQVSYYRLAEVFGAGVGAWSFDRARTMLHILGEQTRLQNEQQKRSSTSPNG